MERAFWRDRRPDTTYFARTGHPDQPTTIAAVRACVAQFSVATVAPRDLLGLGQAYLAADEPALADQAFARLAEVTKQGPIQTLGWTLSQIVAVYLEAAQPQLARAESYLAQLDALGAAVAPDRTRAHVAMAQQARFRDSIPLQARESAAALKASQEITGDARKEYAGTSCMAYWEVAYYRARMNDGPGAYAIMQKAKSTLVPLRPMISLCLAGMEELRSIGQTAPPIRATDWYNTGTPGNQRPISGKPSLIVFATMRNEYAFVGYGVLRRLVAKYAVRGLDVTFVTRTRGYVGGSVVTPDSEAVRVRDYFLKELQLPVTVALTKSDFGHRSDGRKILTSATNETAYQVPGLIPLPTYVIDSNGTVRMVTALDREDEAVLDDVLQELFDNRATP